ncbi:hypothetical protein ACA910_013377 [Epithemia clementina (nom. ined.)]
MDCSNGYSISTSDPFLATAATLPTRRTSRSNTPSSGDHSLNHRLQHGLLLVIAVVCWTIIMSQSLTAFPPSTTPIDNIIPLPPPPPAADNESRSTMAPSSTTKRRKSLLVDLTQTIPLMELVETSPESTCPTGMMRLNDFVEGPNQNNKTRAASSSPLSSNSSNSSSPGIPRILHILSLSRCVTPPSAQALETWQSQQLEQQQQNGMHPPIQIYVHNAAAMHRLVLERQWAEFPNMRLVLAACSKSMQEPADLWRALVLWEYGGVAIHMDHVLSFLKQHSNQDKAKSNNNNNNTDQVGDVWSLLMDSKISPDANNGRTHFQHHHEAILQVSKREEDERVVMNPSMVAAQAKHPLLYLWVLQGWNRLYNLPDVEYYPYHSHIYNPWTLQQALKLFLRPFHQLDPPSTLSSELTTNSTAETNTTDSGHSHTDTWTKLATTTTPTRMASNQARSTAPKWIVPPYVFFRTVVPPGHYIGLDHRTVTIVQTSFSIESPQNGGLFSDDRNDSYPRSSNLKTWLSSSSSSPPPVPTKSHISCKDRIFTSYTNRIEKQRQEQLGRLQ